MNKCPFIKVGSAPLFCLLKVKLDFRSPGIDPNRVIQ